MRFISRILFLLLFAATFLTAQTQVNPSTQINWSAVSGIGSPSSGCPNIVSSTITSGSAVVSVSSTIGLLPHQSVSGSGIPSGAKILSVSAATDTIRLNLAATASGAQSLSFYPIGQPYTDLTGGTGLFTCTMAGWKGGGSGGSCNVALSVNGSLLTGCVALITVNNP